ncbi:hypothetical protein [Sphingopyxis sp.]|uniref:hypothetical protein n=1 Tax=Sphingopyxis sp. TaxID=1908224 RepID=UPI002E03B2E8|nr:hypothetical protein [Sphingopyxis sp.]
MAKTDLSCARTVPRLASRPTAMLSRLSGGEAQSDIGSGGGEAVELLQDEPTVLEQGFRCTGHRGMRTGGHLSGHHAAVVPQTRLATAEAAAATIKSSFQQAARA